MFRDFFSIIAARPDYTQDWPFYQGYIIESYTLWVGRRDDSYGMFFDEHLFYKYKIPNLVPTLMEQLRQPVAGYGSSGGDRGFSSRSRGRSFQNSGAPTSNRGGFQGQGSFLSSQPFNSFQCYLCRGPHSHKDHHGSASHLITNDHGKWVDKALSNKIVCISLTSFPLAVDGVQRVTTATPALCVATCHMDARDALLDTIFPIVTKLKANAWELALANAGILNKFNDIPVGLWEGSYCGLENYSLSYTSIPSNHFTSKEDEAFIVLKYTEEITLGRISHGYDPHELFSLIGHFRTAPLTVITRNGKHRVIVNHFFSHTNETCISLDNQPQNTSSKIIIDPTQTSINTVIDSKKFQCVWGSFSECYLLVADATEGTQAAIFNVDSAFRNIPIHPSACPFLAIMLKERIHLDHVLNFGASPSPGIFGQVADAIIKIFLHHGIEAIMK
jgi:hypothetical protein